MLEKSHGTMKNRQSRDTGNIGYKTQRRQTKQKKRNTKVKDIKQGPHEQNGVNHVVPKDK